MVFESEDLALDMVEEFRFLHRKSLCLIHGPLGLHVRVQHCGLDVRMPEELLQRFEIKL